MLASEISTTDVVARIGRRTLLWLVQTCSYWFRRLQTLFIRLGPLVLGIVYALTMCMSSYLAKLLSLQPIALLQVNSLGD